MAFGKSKVVGIQQRSLRKVIRGDTSINEIIRELTPAKQKTKAKAKAKPKPKPEQ